MEDGRGTHLSGGTDHFNKTPWKPTYKCSFSKTIVQEQKSLCEIHSFSYFTFLCSKCWKNQPCSEPCRLSYRMQHQYLSVGAKHQTKPGRMCCIWCYKQMWEQSEVNTRSLLVCLSWTFSDSHNSKTMLPVLFPGIHENDRNFPFWTSSDTGAALKQHSLQVSACLREGGEELLPHKAGVCVCSVAVLGKPGSISQLSCNSTEEVSIQCATLDPLHLP